MQGKLFDKSGGLTFVPLALYGVAAIGLCLIIALSIFPPLQDFWEWSYQGALIQRMLSEGTAEAPFAFKTFPVPNSLSQAAIALLSFVTTPIVAAKLVLIAYVAGTYAVFRSLRDITSTDRAGYAILILFSLMIGSQFFNGYINNNFGNLFLLLYFTRLIARVPSPIETLAFSVLVFFCHATSYAVFGMVVVIFFLWNRLNWQHLAAMVPTGLMFIWYMASKEPHTLDSLVLEGPIDWLAYKIYTVTKLGPYHNFFVDNLGDRAHMPAWFWIGVAVNLLFGLFIAWLILRTYILPKFDWTAKPEIVAPGLLLAAYPLMPDSVSGVVNIGERFLTIAILLLVVAASTLKLQKDFMAGAVLSAFIVPIIGVFGVLTFAHFPEAGHREPAIGTLEKESRLNVLYWHRSFQSAYRLDNIHQIRTEGLKNAPPLDFTTSLIWPKPVGADIQEDEALEAPPSDNEAGDIQ